MAKYIDVEKIQFEPDPWGGMNGVLISIGRGSGKTVKLVQDALRAMVDHAPAEDVTPVVHGYWEKGKKPNWQMPMCSACKAQATTRSSYCPHCGAKMDGDGNA